MTDVLSLSLESITPPPRWRGRDEQEGTGIQGLGKRDDGVSIILDVLRLLSAQDVHLDLSPETLAADETAVADKAATEENRIATS